MGFWDLLIEFLRPHLKDTFDRFPVVVTVSIVLLPAGTAVAVWGFAEGMTKLGVLGVIMLVTGLILTVQRAGEARRAVRGGVEISRRDLREIRAGRKSPGIPKRARRE